MVAASAQPGRLRRRAGTRLTVALGLCAALVACSDGRDETADGSFAPATTDPAGPGSASVVPGSTASTGGVAPASSAAPGTAAPGTATPGTATTGTVTTEPFTMAPPVLVQVRVQLHQLARFDEPVAVATRPADPAPGRLYVVERGGLIKAMDPDGTVDERPVADLTALTAPGGERGLLGLAFSPDGTKLYVNYTDLDGNTNVDELTLTTGTGTVADPASRRRLLFVEQPYANHNGGHILVGPDGYLYIGMGDGGAGGDPQRHAQDLGSLLGKLLRIDPTPGGAQPYTVPADNPFVGRAGARPEIWSVGLRNPWGFSFDPATGDLWLADVGQDAVEEVNVSRRAAGAGRGVNFGWSVFEGSTRYNDDVEADGAVAPVYEYEHGSAADQGCSITGGVVYRRPTVPNLAGAYLFADFCVSGIRAIPTEGEADARVLLDGPGSIAGFGYDGDGEVLVLSLDGAVSRIEPQS